MYKSIHCALLAQLMPFSNNCVKTYKTCLWKVSQIFYTLIFYIYPNCELVSTHKSAYSLQHTNFSQAIPKFVQAYNCDIFSCWITQFLSILSKNYGTVLAAETWCLKVKTVAKLNSTEMDFWRRSARISGRTKLGIILLNKKWL